MARIEEIKEKGVEELFPEAKRSIIKSRLEEMAYIFHALQRDDIARLSLAGARSLEEKDSMLGVNAFLKAMIDRSLNFYAEIEDNAGSDRSPGEERDTAPRIIVP